MILTQVWAESAYPVIDAIRWLDFILAVSLGLGILVLAYFRWVERNHAALAVLTSWWGLNLTTAITNVYAQGEAVDARLPLRVFFHLIGLAYVFVALWMRYEGKDPFRNSQEI